MKTFKQFVNEQEELEEKMGKVGTAIAAGLLGAVAGHSIASHKPVTSTPHEKVIKKEAPKATKKKVKSSEESNSGVDAGVLGVIAQM